LRFLPRAALIALAIFACALPAQASARGLDAYDVTFESGKQLEQMARLGFDMTEARRGHRVEIVATTKQAKQLRSLGLAPKRKTTGGATKRSARSQRLDGSWDVYRPYFDDTYVGHANSDGTGAKRETLYQELQRLAFEHQNIVKSEIIGRTINNKPILALKVTKDAREVPDGQRPATLYSSTQHAREWLATETDRRLAHLFVDNYGGTGPAVNTNGVAIPGVTKQDITSVVTKNELWFVVVANPDGYDYTFTPGNRLWRKNLRDNNHDGQITPEQDGVDPNRNYPTKWDYDNEGSSGDFASETYRGTGPASEPETKALDGLLKRVDFEMQINYHTAAELLLYPAGWQVETYTADDPIYRALSGTDADSAIKGSPPGAPDNYDPDVAAELYTTNGETTDHAHGVYGTLAWTPELDVGDAARGGGGSVFEFQDRDDDVEQAFEKNIPFALDIARSAKDPANPVSHLGNEPADFEVARFAISYGDPQPVQVDAKRELGKVTMRYRINGGAAKSADTQDWKGGERYGKGYDVYYHQLRGVVKGTRPGDEVKVWFEAGGKKSQAFTYSAAQESSNKVLVLASEDYTGHSPDYANTSGPNYLRFYQQALQANRVGYDVYDTDAHNRTAPDALGVLSHYKAIVWYTGDNERTIEPDQPPAGAGASKLSDDEFRAVRDFLNEGGKLLYTGKKAGWDLSNQFVFNAQDAPPYCNAGAGAPEGACIPLSNDFLQYYLGSYGNNALRDPNSADTDEDAQQQQADLDNMTIDFFDPMAAPTAQLNGGDSANNQDYAYTLTPTSTVLPVSEYPQFRSKEVGDYSINGPLAPKTGDRYMYSQVGDHAYKRLTRTVDLTGKTSGRLKFATSWDLEQDYDYMFVEAHTVGQDDWTTLPDANGNTTPDVNLDGSSCTDGWAAPEGQHPFLAHYLDPNTCAPHGTTGDWNAATGNSGGYRNWDIDLSGFANKQVEVSISVATDPFVQGLGSFVDDTQVLADGAEVAATSFETDDGGWTIGGPPAGSVANPNNWIRTTALVEESAAVATDDTLYYGFGFEGVRGAAKRNALMKSAMSYLGVLRGSGPGPGAAPGPSPAPAAPAPAARSDYSLRLSKSKLRVDRKHRTKVRLACGPTTKSLCKGTVSLRRGARTVMGRRTFTTTANKSRSITVRVSSSAYRRLVRKKSIKTTVTLVSRGADGVMRKQTQRVTMVRAKAAKSNKKQ
jgi:Zinc carboxypeptidase/Immune inhibitor A peptidase M6